MTTAPFKQSAISYIIIFDSTISRVDPTALLVTHLEKGSASVAILPTWQSHFAGA